MLSRLITGASRMINNHCERDGFYIRSVTELQNGGLTNQLFLRQYPVISVTALSINTQAVSAQTNPPYGTGYMLEPWNGNDACGPQAVTVYGSTPIACLANSLLGTNNVSITYQAGYQQVDTFTLVSTTTYTTARPWSSDQGVSYASGAALVKVAASPAQGQYTVSSSGVYGFSAADEGVPLAVTYGYTPEDLQQACIELVGERYRTRQRIGMTSQGLGGQETTTFSQKSMNDFILESINPFVNVSWISS